MPWSSASWIAGHAVPHRHLDRRRERHAAAGVLDQPPRLVAADACSGCIRRPAAAARRAPSSSSALLGAVADAVRDARARRPRARARTSSDRGRRRAPSVSNWSLRAEIGALQPHDVLRILRARPGAARIGVDRADAGLLQRADAGVAVLGRVADLRDVDHGGRAHVDHAERGRPARRHRRRAADRPASGRAEMSRL